MRPVWVPVRGQMLIAAGLGGFSARHLAYSFETGRVFVGATELLYEVRDLLRSRPAPKAAAELDATS